MEKGQVERQGGRKKGVRKRDMKIKHEGTKNENAERVQYASRGFPGTNDACNISGISSTTL